MYQFAFSTIINNRAIFFIQLTVLEVVQLRSLTHWLGEDILTKGTMAEIRVKKRSQNKTQSQGLGQTPKSQKLIQDSHWY